MSHPTPPGDQPVATVRGKMTFDQDRSSTAVIALPAGQPSTGGALDLSEWFRYGRIGRTKTYAEAKAGRLKLRKLGNKTIILRCDADEYLRSLPMASATSQSAKPKPEVQSRLEKAAPGVFHR